jgi:lysophospholipase L1-like esterase
VTERRSGDRPGIVLRGVRSILRVLLFALLVALVAEGFLRAASLFASDRAGVWRPGAAVRILSVGDSHTYGTSVSDEESYPAQLQGLLDEVEPGRFSVINLGIPGISSTQVRRRLGANVARYEPDLVIVWCGVNDYWNTIELDGAGATWSARLDSLALRSRLYRFIRVWQNDRAVSASTESLRVGGVHQRIELDEGKGWGASPDVTVTFHHGGRAETIRTEKGSFAEGTDPGERSYREFRSMASFLRTAGIGLIFVRYPLAAAFPFAPANEAMERLARELSLPIVDSWAAISRIPKEEWKWTAMAHPSGPMYREIARDLVPLILQPAVAAP